MATKTDVDHILSQIDGYIVQSAKYAAEHCERNKITLSLFDGIYVEMTQEFCVRLYKELITDLIKAGRVHGSNYSLYAMLYPTKGEDGSVIFTVQLGISFPFLQSDSGV